MLNLSPQNNIELVNQASLQQVESKKTTKKLKRTVYVLLILLIVIMLLPWTQNIPSGGKISTLRPEQKPQTINTVISGKIEKWFVKDGDIVKKGDTILFISEVKDDYFDPILVGRTEQQLKSKEMSVMSYSDKIRSLDVRVDALLDQSRLKLQQTKLKLNQTQLKYKTDSIEYHTAELNLKIAEDQYNRFEKLVKAGFKSQTELETRKLTLQRTQANVIATQQKLLQSRNDILDARVEYSAVISKFRDEVSKAESDKFTALSSMYEAEVDVTKLQGKVASYSIRNGMYYVLAPQDGVVTKVLSSGIGETIKEGAAIATIMPSIYDLVVEIYIKPVDLPLVKKGDKARLQFDGWPAIVFSGWPNANYGTFDGEVFAIDNFADDQGRFRVLIAPDKKSKPWPKALRVGGGTNSIILLNNVPIGYELWRLTNGFPPQFYKPKEPIEKPKK
ncbi:MAG: HlyD family efflux transporter periplasmic adaptor subunit [Flavobacteriia bacterium]|nr:HlyD family efflux transporter periplasmic adaptor subunit [Flavobacteriia bacterium]NBY41052.1 HlyD family efflux transporter periplasmic adaptor subunit [Flavobacteriia bacterium]